MIPAYPACKPLELADRPWIKKHLRASSREICELTLGNLFIWQDFDRTEVTCVNRNICLKVNARNGETYFLEPLGRNKLLETVEILLRSGGRLSRVSAGFAALLPKEYYRLLPLRDQFDYIYLRSDLAELKGRKFDGKRNHLKRFRTAHPAYIYKPLDRSLQTDALTLFTSWFQARKETQYFKRLAYPAQKNALLSAFANFQELHLCGGALYVDNALKAFTIGSSLNPATVSVHFLYADPALHGVFQATLWEASNKTYRDFKYLDLEQDLGIPGLRTSKLSYQPLRLEEKLEVKKT